MGLLQLKQQVIAELKNEADLQGPHDSTPYEGIGMPGYVDPFSRLEQQMKDKQTGKPITLKGQSTRESWDGINIKSRGFQRPEQTKPNELRQSAITYVGSRPSLSED